MRSLPDPSLAPFDPEIKRTISHLRQSQRRLAFEGDERVPTNSPTLSKVESETSFEEETIYSSIRTTNTSSIDLGSKTMATPRRVTLKEPGAPDFILQSLQVHHLELNANFELKTTLINLLPKFHGLSAQDPIRYLRDFLGVCSTTRREGSDEVAIWLFAFPFSLERRAKEWFYTLPDEIVSDWNLLRREFLDKFFPPEVTDRLRKEISCIVQGEMETLYEYWERFRRLLDSCPYHMIDILMLISYFCQGMKPQDKILLHASSNGSLRKYKTAEEAWQLITDLAESTKHARQRNNHPRAINEVSTSGETGGINAITLRSGTKLQERSHEEPSPIEVTQDEDVVELEEVEEEDEAQEVVEEVIAQLRGGIPKDGNVLQEATPIPFPTLARKTKKQVDLDPKMLEIFKKVEVTIPLFDAMHQVTKFSKFLKDLCMNNEKLNDLETIPLGSSISTLTDDVPEKCGDLGPCLVTCTKDGVQFVDCMCGLGACVSIMPLFIYEVLKLPPLKQSAAQFVLADKSIIFVVGIAEDVLLSIKGLVLLIDFHILKMPPSDSGRTSSILLGRPFLKTSRFKLDAFSGTYSFEID
ncbi:uncharacterized protein LOC107640699 [Arachis ipaensis]|uniref:uncharacterized protein LOC107640699 n=1 Tax=Arachis ipaensis TaxID=130454 RepID=UPI0007AFCAF8|nr:uncharacterized protein LOC107640699 [Arachis ipaensis]